MIKSPGKITKKVNSQK